MPPARGALVGDPAGDRRDLPEARLHPRRPRELRPPAEHRGSRAAHFAARGTAGRRAPARGDGRERHLLLRGQGRHRGDEPARHRRRRGPRADRRARPRARGQVLREDKDVDLAVLEAVTAHDVAPLPLARDADVPLGEPVFTIGFPVPGVLGNDPKFSEGSLGGQTGLGAAWLYQVTVPVQPGNSGGPLVDHHGLVVGVIVAKLRADRLMVEQGVTPENVNFAIKSVELRRMLRGLPLSSAKAARTRQAAVKRTEASVCHVIATPAAPPQPAPGDVVAPAPAPRSTAAPKADAPPAPPSPPAGAATDQHRISGDPHIYPDAATVNEMRRVGLIALRASVEVCIATTGEVTSVSISRSSGYPAYDTKLAHEIARWRYSPRAGNQADPECRVISFKYRLADHEAGGGAAPGHVPPGTSGQP
ncbi:MAG: TonB family protein [Myxococcales bacterium]|nr:TonB family protein [Myxococcales bacterium]